MASKINTKRMAKKYPASKIRYLKSRKDYYLEKNGHLFGFHYTPYNFDSFPEKDYLVKILEELKMTLTI